MASIPQVLIDKLEARAREENLTPAELLSALLEKPVAKHQQPEREQKSGEELAREVILRAYERARRYWREHGEHEKAAMTDAEMDEHFWLFDQEDIPRLKSEKDRVELLPGTLRDYAEKVAQHATFTSEYTDTVERSREILNKEYADYLLRRMGHDT